MIAHGTLALISFLSLRKKQPHMTFLCPGFKPSATDGIERILSAIENRISSLLMSPSTGSRQHRGSSMYQATGSISKRRSKYSTKLLTLNLAKPFFTIVSFLLAEGQLNELAVSVLRRTERNHMFAHVAEIIAGVAILARTKTLSKQ